MNINKFVEGIGWVVLGVLAIIAGMGLVGCELSDSRESQRGADLGPLPYTFEGPQCVGDAGVPVCLNPNEEAACTGDVGGNIEFAYCSGGVLMPCSLEGMVYECLEKGRYGL